MPTMPKRNLLYSLTLDNADRRHDETFFECPVHRFDSLFRSIVRSKQGHDPGEALRAFANQRCGRFARRQAVGLSGNQLRFG